MRWSQRKCVWALGLVQTSLLQNENKWHELPEDKLLWLGCHVCHPSSPSCSPREKKKNK